MPPTVLFEHVNRRFVRRARISWVPPQESDLYWQAAILRAIFDPLQRGPNHKDGNADGNLGLGLYIAREIARAHGGEINARSDETETVFSVRLPRGK